MSDQSHSVLSRAAMMIGVRPEGIRLVPSDARARLDMAALARAVTEDRAAGLNPIAVCANAGAASTGAIDPLDAMADFCKTEGIWLHVDAAYGGFAVVTEAGKRLLAGIERADSIGLDAHKWFFQPYEAGCLLVKDGRTLENAFELHHDVLQDTIWGADHPNLADRGLQLSRAFRALKVWMSVQTFGMAAFRRAVSNGMELAARAEEYIRQSPTLELLIPVSLSIVCFRVNPTDTDLDEEALEKINRNVLARVFWEDPALMSSTQVGKTFFTPAVHPQPHHDLGRCRRDPGGHRALRTGGRTGVNQSPPTDSQRWEVPEPLAVAEVRMADGTPIVLRRHGQPGRAAARPQPRQRIFCGYVFSVLVVAHRPVRCGPVRSA